MKSFQITITDSAFEEKTLSILVEMLKGKYDTGPER